MFCGIWGKEPNDDVNFPLSSGAVLAPIVLRDPFLCIVVTCGFGIETDNECPLVMGTSRGE